MEKYLEGENFRSMRSRRIRRATLAAKLTPVLTGTAFKNKGVQPMLDAVIDFLPSPWTSRRSTATRWATKKLKSCASPATRAFQRAGFKIMTDPHLGKLTYVRVYSGSLADRTQVL